MNQPPFIQARQPFSFGHSLAFTCGFSPMAGEQSIEGGRLRKAHEIGGRAIGVDVEAGAGGALAVTLHADSEITARDQAAALDCVRFTLSLDDDLVPFHALAERDAAFAPVARAQHGHHQVKFPSAFEITVGRSAQRTPMRLARSVKRAIVERFGASIALDGERHLAFPTAKRLASASDAELHGTVKHAIKAAAMPDRRAFGTSTMRGSGAGRSAR